MIGDFFIWCSGAKKEVLKECPIERGKFIGMGMAVFFVSLLSFISATFFITYAFSNKIPDKITGELKFEFNILYLMAGLLWSIIIFTIDKNIVASIRKRGNINEEIKKAWPRIVLALFIGIVVSTPLEMKFFEKEINQIVEANIYKEENFKARQDLKNIEVEIKTINTQIAGFEKDRDDAYGKAVEEKEGKGLSGIKRYGKKSKEWERKSEVYSKQADSLKTILLMLNTNLSSEKQKNSLEALRQNGTINKYDGAEKRIYALYQLGGFHLIITLLFITIEILPLMVKLMAERGPYDEVLDRIEYEYFIKQKEIISNTNSEINGLLEEIGTISKLKTETRITIQKSKLDAEIKANDSLLTDIANKQANLAKVAIKKWYATELEKLKDDDQYNFVKQNQLLPLNVNHTSKISGKFWLQKDSPDKLEYFFRNGALVDNDLLYFENDIMQKGKWSYNDGKDEVSIILNNELTTYIISELSDSMLRWNEKGTAEVIEFEVK